MINRGAQSLIGCSAEAHGGSLHLLALSTHFRSERQQPYPGALTRGYCNDWLALFLLGIHHGKKHHHQGKYALGIESLSSIQNQESWYLTATNALAGLDLPL